MPKLLLEDEKPGDPLPPYPCELMFRIVGRWVTWKTQPWTKVWDSGRGKWRFVKKPIKFAKYSEPQAWYYRSKHWKAALRLAKQLNEWNTLEEFSYSHLHWKPVPAFSWEGLEDA